MINKPSCKKKAQKNENSKMSYFFCFLAISNRIMNFFLFVFRRFRKQPYHPFSIKVFENLKKARQLQICILLESFLSILLQIFFNLFSIRNRVITYVKAHKIVHALLTKIRVSSVYAT